MEIIHELVNEPHIAVIVQDDETHIYRPVESVPERYVTWRINLCQSGVLAFHKALQSAHNPIMVGHA